jgi:hypothetical protein
MAHPHLIHQAAFASKHYPDPRVEKRGALGELANP